MSQIRCVYSSVPKFPAIDQHPDAVRYAVGVYIVDAIGGEPTPAEIQAVLQPPPPSADELEAACAAYLNGGGLAVDLRKVLKATVINFTARVLGVAPGALTPAQMLTERNRIAGIFRAL